MQRFHSCLIALAFAIATLSTAGCATSSSPTERTGPALPRSVGSVQAVDAVHATAKVEPPVAVHQPAAKYTQEARKARIQGVVIARLTIDERGRVSHVSIIKRLPMGLTRQAIEALERYRFEPSTVDGEPIAVHHVVRVDFRL